MATAAQTRLNLMAWVDLIDVCNLKCPTCIRGTRGMTNTGKSMPLNKFDRIVQKIRDEGYSRVALFSWTEPFINPKLAQYVEVVKRHGLFCQLSTNFSLRRIPALEATLRAGVDYLTISVSGFDQSVYEINHIGGNLTYVKDNTRRVAELKRSGAIPATQVVLRFIEFDYNHDQKEKLAAFARDLDIEFETIEGGGGDPRNQPFVPDNDYYVDQIKSYRAERPHDSVGKVCNLIFSQTPIDAEGDVFLCCAYPYYESLHIGSYLNLPQEEILLRRYTHPMCASCSAPRRDATADDHQALADALAYRMGPIEPAAPALIEAPPEPVAVAPGPPPVVVVERVGTIRRLWRGVAPMPLRQAVHRLRVAARQRRAQEAMAVRPNGARGRPEASPP